MTEVVVWRRSLVWRIAGSFFVLALVVAGAAAWASVVRTRAALREAALDRLETAAVMKQYQLDRWVTRSISDLKVFAELPEMRLRASRIAADLSDHDTNDPVGADADLSTLLSVLTTGRDDFRALYLLSARGGQAVSSTDLALLGAYHASESFFLGGRDSTTVMNVYPSPVTGRPTITLATPVRSAAGTLVGVLAADLDLTRLDQILSERVGLGRTGEAYLVDRYSQFVTGTRYGRPAFSRGVHTAVIDRAVAGASGRGEYQDYRGFPSIGVFKWLPDRQLALFVEMQAEEAFAPANAVAITIALFGVIAALAMGLGGWWMAQRITRPLREIADAARKVRGGDLGAVAPVQSQDEIGGLARAFNEMTGRLHTLYAGLQAQITETERAARASASSLQLLQSILDRSAAMVIVKDRAGRYLLVNHAFERFHRVSRDHALGRTSREVLDPAMIATVQDGERELHEKGDLLAREERVTRDGVEHVLLTERFPLHDEEGHVFGHGVVSTDITAQLLLESRVQQAQKLEAVGRLAGGIAHDFNNLLSVVRCNLELVAETLDEPDARHELLNEVQHAVRSGAALTRQLLTFSRTQVVQPRALDLNASVESMSSMLRRFGGPGVTLDLSLDADLPLVIADGNQVEQVLLNLFTNAVDALPEGGRVTVRTIPRPLDRDAARALGVEPASYAELVVTDDGTGMDVHTRTRLFEPFFTTKSAGRGSGLGLSTVYAIVEQAGGHILVESEPGLGTTITIRLPAADLGSSLPVAAPISPPSLARARAQRLLVVDDEAPLRMALARLLGRRGYEVMEADSGAVALQLLAEPGNEVDVVLTDVFMPGMGGRELAERLAEQRPGLPVVFMSGYTADEVLRRGLMDARTPFLQKPFELDELDRIMGTLAQRAHSMSGAAPVAGA
ncbi:MAG: Blue-light-activated protein [Gemmatimonadetes bacterium]|nr:Blue-light-activated protein [Gemmatimonadota bacterium]